MNSKKPLNEVNSVRKETSRSLILRCLQAALKPLNRLLIRVNSVSKEGSQAILIPSSLKTRYSVQENLVGQIYTYDLCRVRSTLNDPKQRTHHIYYFAGGGFQSPPSSHHYRFLGRLLSQLSSTTVITSVAVPLAPNNTAPTTFPILLDFCKRILSECQSNGTIVTFAGDSSGGNLALSLTLELLKQDPTGPVPNSVLVICPVVDLAHYNPASVEVEKDDPLLRLKFSKEIAPNWAGEWDVKTDSRLSPIRATNLASLRERGVAVYGMTGSYDILAPDTVTLRDRLIDRAIKGKWLDWKGCMHCWVLMAGYGLFCKEIREGFEWVAEALREMEGAGGNDAHADAARDQNRT
jgi:acetyl esterase/lipase